MVENMIISFSEISLWKIFSYKYSKCYRSMVKDSWVLLSPCWAGYSLTSDWQMAAITVSVAVIKCTWYKVKGKPNSSSNRSISYMGAKTALHVRASFTGGAKWVGMFSSTAFSELLFSYLLLVFKMLTFASCTRYPPIWFSPQSLKIFFSFTVSCGHGGVLAKFIPSSKLHSNSLSQICTSGLLFCEQFCPKKGDYFWKLV